MSKLLKVEFEGEQYECDASALRDYAVIKAISKADVAPAKYFDALERVFAGRDEEYAEKVGGLEAMARLLEACVTATAGAKN